MAVSKEAVIWAYRLLLGREPESEEVIRLHMQQAQNEDTLAENMIRSTEFQQKRRFSSILLLKSPSLVSRPSFLPKRASSRIKIIVMGNCQARQLARCMEAMAAEDIETTSVEWNLSWSKLAVAGEVDLSSILANQDIVLVHPAWEVLRLIEKAVSKKGAIVRVIPRIAFQAFHPDLVYVDKPDGSHAQGPLGGYNSSLAFFGWTRGMSVSQTVRMFTDEIYKKLDFYQYWEPSREALLDEGIRTEMPLEELLGDWAMQGCFMHSINHPKLPVICDLAQCLLNGLGIETIEGVEKYIHDEFSDGPVWPVYPEIAQRYGMEGNYSFKIPKGAGPPNKPAIFIGLEDFVKASFKAYSNYRKEDLVCERLNSDQYKGLESFVRRRLLKAVAPRESRRKSVEPISRKNSPYHGLPAHHFWGRAVTKKALPEVDPVVSADLTIGPRMKVCTAGSCFAQHISSALRRRGFNYYIAEQPNGLSERDAAFRNYGVFSARYGNIYTARQLLQLFDRAYGTFLPSESIWRREDGLYADPFRPRIEPDGFASPDILEKSRSVHLEAVRKMMENLDILVFTLGLTEAWVSKEDGAVFPLAPGVAAGEMNNSRYEFVNFGVNEITCDFNEFCRKLLQVNKGVQIILTVSPVPLAATFENRHVLVSTTYSKSVLRVAADQISRLNSNCFYFPAYEIITGHYNRGAYYDSDLRSVNAAGVEHVMRLFFKHYCMDSQSGTIRTDLRHETEAVNRIVCDEEETDHSYLSIPANH